MVASLRESWQVRWRPYFKDKARTRLIASVLIGGYGGYGLSLLFNSGMALSVNAQRLAGIHPWAFWTVSFLHVSLIFMSSRLLLRLRSDNAVLAVFPVILGNSSFFSLFNVGSKAGGSTPSIYGFAWLAILTIAGLILLPVIREFEKPPNKHESKLD